MQSRTQHTAFMALATVVVAMACLVSSAVFNTKSAYAGYEYGQICAEFESSTNPYDCDLSDPYGGNVFGAFQMSAGNAIIYARELKASSNKTLASYGTKLVNGYVADGNKCTKKFGAAWKAIFPNDKAGYLSSQYAYVKKAYYDPAVANWQKAVPGFKASSYSAALQNVIFSTAVQHGTSGSASIFSKAMSAIGGYKSSYAEDKLIWAVYAERARVEDYATLKKRVSGTVYKITQKDGGSYAVKYGLIGKSMTHFYSNPGYIQSSVYNRLAVEEPNRVFALYKQITNKGSSYSSDTVRTATDPATCSHEKTTGGTVTGYSALTDKSHVEHISARRCATCGTLIKAAYARTVANSFKQSGASWKDVSGRKYTVHEKGWYRTRYDLNVRSKASTKGTLKTAVAKKTCLKITKTSMGSDGFWWGKTTVNGTSGWVQMQYLAFIGTGLGVHKYNSNNVCVYCGKTKSQISKMAKMVAAVGLKTRTYKTKAAVKAYKVAYTNAKRVKKSYKKNTKVKVVKIVRNRYYDYWAKLADGSYIELSNLK